VEGYARREEGTTLPRPKRLPRAAMVSTTLSGSRRSGGRRGTRRADEGDAAPTSGNEGLLEEAGYERRRLLLWLVVW